MSGPIQVGEVGQGLGNGVWLGGVGLGAEERVEYPAAIDE